MELPAIGSVVAVQYARNPTVYSDAAMMPRLFFGRVVRHEGSWGFTAALCNYDNLPQESWLEYEQEDEAWTDRSFHQPVESVRFDLDADTLRFFQELESLPEVTPDPADEIRPFAEMRLRFLGAALENGWLNEPEPVVFYSDDLPQAMATVSRWNRLKAGDFSLTDQQARFVWPVEGKSEEECLVTMTRQPSGSYYVKNEEFGDEFEADLEALDQCHLLMGLWVGEGFMSFFCVVAKKA